MKEPLKTDDKTTLSAFADWWLAPEQAKLRLNVAEGWAFRIWLASRQTVSVWLPSPKDFVYTRSAVPVLRDVCASLTAQDINVEWKTE